MSSLSSLMGGRTSWRSYTRTLHLLTPSFTWKCTVCTSRTTVSESLTVKQPLLLSGKRSRNLGVDAMPPRSVAYIHLVRPQEQRHARAVVLQVIVEIVPFGVDIPPNDVPILRRIRWHRDHSMTLETAYMRDHQTGFELLFDAHLDEWCHPRHGVQCNLHIESRIALMAHRHHLLPGSLLEIFIHDDDRPEPSASSQQADLQTGLQLASH